jgi:hypothetical protein
MRRNRREIKHTNIPIRQLHNPTLQLPTPKISSVAFAIRALLRCPKSRARVDGTIVLDTAW